jgi:hypothetical protein
MAHTAKTIGRRFLELALEIAVDELEHRLVPHIARALPPAPRKKRGKRIPSEIQVSKGVYYTPPPKGRQS